MLTTNRALRPNRRHTQRGLSLVELMVGVALGLFIVAGATMLAASQLAANRQLLVATQVQQDLRAAADIITRELRRAGYRPQPERHIWSAASPTTEPVPNLRAGLKLGQNGDVVSYNYERYLGEPGDFGYRLSNNTIRQRIGSTSQDLTDRNTLKITTFTVELENAASQQLACPRLCPGGDQACWPTFALLDAVVTISGQAATNSAVAHTVVSRVRLRNDVVTFDDDTKPVCPA
jgi:type II secretory pathway component PulJ